MNTTTRIPEGARVLYIGGGEENNPSLVGKFGTVQQDDGTMTLPYYVDFEESSDGYNRWWCPGQALVHVPRIGDKVIPVNGEEVGVPAEYRNAVCTVTAVTPEPYGGITISGEFQSYQKPDDTTSWLFREWKPADGHTLTVSSDEGIRAAAQEEIETLRRELARANERVEQYGARAGKWERDFMRYAERIMQEANDRDWCGEYDRIMEEISGDLEIATIPERDIEVEIEWEETYTVTVSRSGTATLRHGYDSDDIERAARDLNGDCDASADDIIQAVRDGEYESCEYVSGSAEES